MDVFADFEAGDCVDVDDVSNPIITLSVYNKKSTLKVDSVFAIYVKYVDGVIWWTRK